MRLFRFIFWLLMSALFFFVLVGKVGPYQKLYVWFNPISGLSPQEKLPDWQAPPNQLAGLKSSVDVYIDSTWVPVIYAENDWDAYFMQGYVSAKWRIFQMDFITRFAAGRLSEIIGPKAIDLDKKQRFLGLSYAAEIALHAFEQDSLSKLAMDAYTAGVNTWLSQVEDKDLPLECKLLQYKPAPWSNFKSALLLKYMADLLTGSVHDIQVQNTLSDFGPEFVGQWFPDYNPNPNASIDPQKRGSTSIPDSIKAKDPFSSYLNKITGFEDPTDGLGSNNWVLHGSRTATGKPFLANDPHLPLSLPSIWMEMHLVVQGRPVYGVTLPGAPGIIIGMNDAVAWGVTNGTVDVKDYLALRLTGQHPELWSSGDVKLTDRFGRDSTIAKNSYFSGHGWEPLSYRKETIDVKGAPSQSFLIPYTKFGPLLRETVKNQHGETLRLTFQWTGFEPSNELRSFLLLNKATNVEECLMALSTFKCPPQNFVFADTTGDIALWQKGLLPNRKYDVGKWVGDARNPDHLWQGFLPDSISPFIKNPKRGFVFSANQHPTPSPYPYAYTGFFELWRNQRILSRLENAKQWDFQDMQALQMDSYSEEAATLLPLMLEKLPKQNTPMYDSLLQWDYVYRAHSQAATFFHQWLYAFEQRLWHPLNPELHEIPERWVLPHILKDNEDKYKTWMPKDTGSVSQWLLEAFTFCQDSMVKETWQSFKATKIQHLARLEGFSVKAIASSGHHTAPNAMTPTHGPSWRMVVSLEPPVNARVSLPGGISGNPASEAYYQGIKDWSYGIYKMVVPGKIPEHPKFHWKCAPLSSP